MYRKPLFLSIVLFLLIACTGLAQADSVEQATKDICTHIKAQNQTAAHTAVSKLWKEYARDPNLGQGLMKVAKAYRHKGDNDKAVILYDQMAQRFGDSNYGQLALIYKAKLDLSQLMKSGDFASAESVITNIKSDFPGRNDLAKQIYIMTKSHGRDRKSRMWLYDQVIAQFPNDKYATIANMQKDKLAIVRMVWKNKYVAANAAVAKLKADYADCDQLGDSLLAVANAYKNRGKLQKADQIYAEVKSKYSDMYSGEKAKISLTKLSIQGLIENSDYDAAKAAIAQFKSDYPDSNSLGCKLCALAESFRRKGKSDHAIWLYKRIIKELPDDKCVQKAQLQLLGTTVRKMVRSGYFSKAEKELKKMKAGCSEHPGFARELSMTANVYAKMGRYERSMQLNDEALNASKSKQLSASTALKNSKIRIYEMIDSNDPDRFINAETAVGKLRDDFGNSKYLNPILNQIADKLHDAGNYEEAKRVFGIVAQDYANNGESGLWAYSNIKRYELFALINADDKAGYKRAIKQVGRDIADDQKRYFVYSCLADKIYNYGAKIGAEDKEILKKYYNRAIDLYENKVLGYIDKSEVEARSYFDLALMYRDLGKYRKALEHCKVLVDEYPGFKSAWYGQYMLGNIYEIMLEERLVSKEQAKTQIREAYTQLIEKYPDCKFAQVAKSWLRRN